MSNVWRLRLATSYECYEIDYINKKYFKNILNKHYIVLKIITNDLKYGLTYSYVKNVFNWPQVKVYALYNFFKKRNDKALYLYTSLM